MKIYTRGGDDGSTALFGGARLAKSDPRIEAYGTLDELNAAIGLAAAHATVAMLPMLQQVQHELFTIGSHLATPAGSAGAAHLPGISAGWVSRLELEIDDAEKQLLPLKQFILPGGCSLAAHLHLARTICRRCERLLVALVPLHVLDRHILPYMNRLGDWLFVMARLANRLAGVDDVPWQKP